jgi:hypothetical protein
VTNTDTYVAIYGFEQADRPGADVGIAVVIFNASYRSRADLVKAVEYKLNLDNDFRKWESWQQNPPAAQDFGLWVFPQLRFSPWGRNSVVRLLCAKAQYLAAILERLRFARGLLSTSKYGSVPSAEIQIAVPLSEVRKFLEFHGFLLGLDADPDQELKDVRRSVFFTRASAPEPSPAVASALYPLLASRGSMTRQSWSTVNSDVNAQRAQEALAGGVILSRKIP